MKRNAISPSRWTVIPHLHRVATVQPGYIDISGPGNKVTLQLCSCTAWRVEGDSRWNGSPFRRRHNQQVTR